MHDSRLHLIYDVINNYCVLLFCRYLCVSRDILSSEKMLTKIVNLTFNTKINRLLNFYQIVKSSYYFRTVVFFLPRIIVCKYIQKVGICFFINSTEKTSHEFSDGCVFCYRCMRAVD